MNLEEFLIYSTKKINTSLKHFNDEIEKSAEEFYSNKKQKDDDLSL